MRKFLLLTGLLFTVVTMYAQSITKTTLSPVVGTVCPITGTYYEVSVPSNLTGCQISWSATNGVVTPDNTNQRKVRVDWNDIPGALGTLNATFVNCNGSATMTELILSVKNLTWGFYTSSINIDYCTQASKVISVPRMYVPGTGGIGQPPQTEVAYVWTLPSGWREVGTNRTGSFGTSTNFITIEPVNCSKPGNVTVYGTLAGAGPFCNLAEKSSTATIALNGANPVATVGPQAGYMGGAPCNVTPVTFYATTSVALGCINSYTWSYPPSWTFVSQTGNSITLRPSGTLSDSNPIKATINFTCGSSIVSGNYTPPFKQPVITAPSTVCYSGGQFTVTDAPVGSSVTWSAQPASAFTVSSGSFAGTGGTQHVLLAAASSIGGSAGTITVTVDAGCGSPVQLQKNLWVGTAEIQDIFFPSVTVAPNQLIPLSIVTYPGSSHGYYKADIIRKFGGYTHTSYGNVIEFSLPLTGTYNVKVYASNDCGWPENAYPMVFFCQVGGGMFSVYPNPAGNYLTINTFGTPENIKETKTAVYQVTLLDETGAEVLNVTTKDKERIDTSHLKKGRYILRVHHQGEVTTQKIIIDR